MFEIFFHVLKYEANEKGTCVHAHALGVVERVVIGGGDEAEN